MSRKRSAILALLLGILFLSGCASPCQRQCGIMGRIRSRFSRDACCPTQCCSPCMDTCCSTMSTQGGCCPESSFFGGSYFEGPMLTSRGPMAQAPGCCNGNQGFHTVPGGPVAQVPVVGNGRLVPQPQGPGTTNAQPQPYQPQQ